MAGLSMNENLRSVKTAFLLLLCSKGTGHNVLLQSLVSSESAITFRVVVSRKRHEDSDIH